MKKILVIDDEDQLRDMVQVALSQKGYEVLQAVNGVEGVQIAREALPDLILCDVNMEKMDGYLTLSSLRNDAPTASIPFILMTGLADNAGMRYGMELGADDYLAKPFSVEALYAAVNARLKKAMVLREQAEQKLADLRDNLSLMLPHELRTPLNGILAYGEILMTDAATLRPSEIAEMGQVINESGRRLQRLIENFLIHAQLEVIGGDAQKVAGLRGRQTVRARRVIEDQARLQAEIASRSDDLRLELADVELAISEEYLSRIVSELAQNAFKFSSAGAPVLISFAEEGSYGVLMIRDQGRGFSTEQLSRIGAYMQFERRVHEQQGLGLGLAIVRRLSEIHGGSVAISGRKGAGAEATVRLPKAR